MGLQRGQIVAVVVIVCAALGYLVFSGMQETMVFYYTVGEVQAQHAELAERPLRIAGKVVPGSIETPGASRLHRDFFIRYGDAEIRVEYRGTGVLPDTLVDDADAVVEGKLSSDGVFHATFVMAKCPSKYESEADYSKYREAGVAASPSGATRP